MKCPRCQQENPTQAKFCLECGASIKAPHESAPLAASSADLQRALSDALGQQAATSEILRVISQSPTDVQPVFDTIVRSAARLLDAHTALVMRLVGDELHLAALTATTDVGAEAAEAAVRINFPTPLARARVPSHVVQTRRAYTVNDVETDPLVGDHIRLTAPLRGYRSMLHMPMVHAGHVIGIIVVTRRRPGPFSDNEVALLQTFADQAVIAIENVRLFNETEEALERETATSEILRVISSSPTDTQPVFSTIAANAARLCAARDAQVLRVEGDVLRLVSAYGSPSMPPVRSISRGHAVGRAVIDRQTIHVRDMAQAVAEFPETSAPQHGVQSVLAVPLLRTGVAVGVIRISRTQIQPFTDAQVALLQTFADQAVIAIENVRLFNELKDKNAALSEALEQQTATAEILRVISRSPSELQPVFDAIVENAVKLCGAAFGGLHRLESGRITLAAQHGLTAEELAIMQRDVFPLPLSRESATGRAILDRAVVHIRDIRQDPDFRTPHLKTMQGFRTILGVPMLRDGIPIGALALWRREVQPFSDSEINLVQSFADQAMIAIENVRLFKELEARNRDLTESLDRQTATADILRTISQAQTDVQPVFDAIADSAMRLRGAWAATVARYDGELVSLVSARGGLPGSADAARERFQPPHRPSSAPEQAVLTNRVQHVVDVETDPSCSSEFRRHAAARGIRSFVAVPMVRGSDPLGLIVVGRAQPGGFSVPEVALLQTFADQAVIAIENARLFAELQERNHALIEAHGQVTEALEKQTATSEILRTIAQAQTDVQPVFDTIVLSAARLCHAANAAVFLTDGSLLYHPANYGSPPEMLAAVRAQYPRPVDMDTTPGMAIQTRSVVQVPDIEEPSALEHVRQIGRLLGFRSVIAVPMLREGEAVGVVNVARREPGRFSDGEVELLKTFADQAVIAVENVRLFKELQARTAALTRSVEQLTALGEVGRAVSSTLDLETVLTTIVTRAVQLSGLDAGVVFEYDEGGEEFVQRAATETGGALAEARRTTRIRKGEGALGRTAITLEPVQVPDITVPGAHESRLREALIESGVRAVLAVPMVREGRLIGCLGVTRNRPGAFPADTIELLRTFATQSALAIQNARLFHELEDKSRQLEAASRHKSEFLANMSHELRTPLNAVIGFSEVLTDRMFGELNEKQDEYLKDIHASGQHLLSLINDILDLSKVEAGRMELELTHFNLLATLDNALTLVRERAGRHGIALRMSVDDRVEHVRADERKIRQVVLNLLSNAIKFTPDGGRIDVRAVPGDGSVEVSVSDTGVGIAPEDQEAIFEEFRQVGTAAKKVEGTGLGLALSRKFIELHGGSIRVESQVGAGSTFTFTIPVRRGE